MNQQMNSSQFQRILVGVNDTPGAKHATEVAIVLANALKAQLVLLGVIAPLSAETQAEGVGLEEASHARAQLEEQIHNTDMAAQKLGIDVVTDILEGDPEEEIESKAEAISADLIVVGHREIGRVRRWLEGSTSEKLVKKSSSSILIVHDELPQ